MEWFRAYKDIKIESISWVVGNHNGLDVQANDVNDVEHVSLRIRTRALLFLKAAD